MSTAQNATGLKGLKSIVEKSGFAVLPECLDEATLGPLCEQFDEKRQSERNILSVPIAHQLAKSRQARDLAQAILGPGCFAVRGIFFNKTGDSNWKVVWHQDVTIAVRERKEIVGFGPWSKKGGILHVQPPAEILTEMLAIRLHLDESRFDNGPLRVIGGSHLQGRLSRDQISHWGKKHSVVCTVPKGGALLMKPLLLHASSACAVSKPRRD